MSILSSIFSENVAGKVVLITGASSGIGEHLAYEYARRGACLVLVARRETRLREVAERACGFGSPEVVVVRADVSKVDDCRRFVDETVNHFGRLDHLLNNAGVASVCKFEDATDITKLVPVMMKKAARGRESSLGCKYNRAKPWEEHEAVGNDVRLVLEKKEVE
ncbi:hypothetical protein HHK36_025205 [Tetracentron sinense]|uniref:Uncharacterized protein n=1 Tax=Tetracentron sinense TaxID=13715 RepID=A0A835D4U1_TETSI|nr:hypothetical protein HHK36_025205 [Tetracentron sinense]